jgi:hypothetical protein
MFRLAAQAQCRRSRLNSNVRPRIQTMRPPVRFGSAAAHAAPAAHHLPRRRHRWRRSRVHPVFATVRALQYAPEAQAATRHHTRLRAARLPRSARSGKAAPAPATSAHEVNCFPSAGPAGVQVRRFPSRTVRSSSHRPTRPNPSFEPTPNGIALGPRGALVHHAPRGPSTIPPVAAQLQR